MHLRSRQPLHDTLAGIRSHQPVSRCGYALAGNAERHLRTRMRLASLYPPEALARDAGGGAALRLLAGRAALQYPDEIVPPGHTPATYLRQETQAGAARRPQGVPEAIATRSRKSWA